MPAAMPLAAPDLSTEATSMKILKAARRPSSPPYRVYAVLCAVLGSIPLLILVVLVSTALENQAIRRAYVESAIRSTATVERFDSKLVHYGTNAVTHYPMVVRYQDGERVVVTQVRNLYDVAPADQPQWIGREVRLLRLAKRPGSEILEENVDLLPRPQEMLQWALLPLLMLGLCIYLAVSLWRKKVTV